MQRRFVTLDVFTGRRFAGNPLAAVLDAEGLAYDAMQTIAREFNLSETVFVLPPDDDAHRARIRIFTPASELPFAGHPTVGAAILLCRIDGGCESRDLILELGIGPVRCHVAPRDDDSGHAVFALPRLPEEVGAPADAATIAAALSIDAGDIGFGDARPSRWSAGAPYTLVPIRDRQAIERCRADLSRWDEAFGFDAHCAAFMFCEEPSEHGHAFHARMFAPRQGVPEDPATGSAVAALAGFIPRFRRLADGDHNLVVEQGYEMGRPSQIELSLSIKAGELEAAAIGGMAVVVSEGALTT